jgi:hypothetical protein
MRAVSLIEPLEDRIAPAAVTIFNNGKSASYTDNLGDTVVVTTTKGDFQKATFTFDPSTAGQLTELNLNATKAFNGASIAFSVLPVAGGTTTVNPGYIDAIGLHLGAVTVPGDLGRIDVGSGKSATALGKLTVNSLDANDATQGGLTYSSVSNITGTVGIVNVLGNLDGVLSAADFNSKVGTGNIKQLNIGGSLDGATASGPGAVTFTGTLTKAVIGGGIAGGSNFEDGSIVGYYATLSKIGSVTVNGAVPGDPYPNSNPLLPGTSILGGAGQLSGSISAATVGTVIVAGDVHGGTGTASGGIEAGKLLNKVTITGSLIGGNFAAGTPSGAEGSGAVFGGAIGTVFIGKDIVGGSGLQSGEVASTGAISKVMVNGDLQGGTAGQSSSNGLAGAIHGASVGAVIIKGTVIGGNLVNGDPNQTGSFDGAILSDTTIGSVTIGKDLTGGSGASSGVIETNGGGLGTLTVGSVTGGSGGLSGIIRIDGTLGKATLAGDLTGGSGTGSGQISVNSSINSLKIGGSVTGGSGDNTGTIFAAGLLKSASIGGDLTGSDSGTTKVTNTGYIQASGIGTLTIGGALTAGTAGIGGLDTSGAIRSTVSIGTLTIGSVVGNPSNPAIISAVGQARLLGTPTTDVAINKLTIKGDSIYADILAGYNTDTSTSLLGTGVNADAQIGTVTIGTANAGTVYEATNIIAGVGPGSTGFGTAGSVALSGAGVADLPSLISKISKVVINGTANPTANGTDSFGIAAQYIASATYNGTKLALLAGPDNDTFASGHEIALPPATAGADVFLYEV